MREPAGERRARHAGHPRQPHATHFFQMQPSDGWIGDKTLTKLSYPGRDDIACDGSDPASGVPSPDSTSITEKQPLP